MSAVAASLQPVVVVNGETIPAADIALEAQNHPAPPGKPGLAWRAAARALAIRALLLQTARDAGMEAVPKTLAPGKRETEEEALVRAVLEARITPPPPDPEAARRIYDADPARFRGPALYEAAHILFAAPPDDEAARRRAAERADAVLEILARDPAAFERLAREESACESRSAGGRLGQIATGDTVPEFEAALDALAEGEFASTPIPTRYGLHVIRLDARLPGLIPEFETVAPRIVAQIERVAWVRAARDVTAALVAQAEISGVDFPRAA